MNYQVVFEGFHVNRFSYLALIASLGCVFFSATLLTWDFYKKSNYRNFKKATFAAFKIVAAIGLALLVVLHLIFQKTQVKQLLQTIHPNLILSFLSILLPGIVLVELIIYKIVAFAVNTIKRKSNTRNRQKKENTTIQVGVVVWSIVFFLSMCIYMHEVKNYLNYLLKTGNFSVVKGLVNNLKIEKVHDTGDRIEPISYLEVTQFTVNGVNFSYVNETNFDLHTPQCFTNKYRSERGPIIEGLPVKISYKRNDCILKIEIANKGRI